MKELTKRQRQFLEFIESFLADHGYPPSIREMQNAFGLKSTKGVKDHIDRLVEKGHLLRETGSARAIALPEFKRSAGRRLADRMAPIIGRVAAGHPLLAEENEEGRLAVPSKYASIPNLFWLRVNGDSMINDGIHHGDLVLVDPAPFVDQGSIAVVLVEDEATVKRFYMKGDTIRLVPANDTFKPMEFFGRQCEGIRIAGKVIAVLRYIA